MMLMPQVASAAMLRPNERPVQVWRAGLEKDSYDPEENEHGTFNLNGVLIATDQRLVFVQEKGMFGKSYKPLESIEYREIANWRLGQTMRIRSLQVDVAQGRDRRKVFNNLSERMR
ncbi:MAG TPA: PH domain-containing protein, partial [Methanomassiliicoccales archaeon]|nr:PH domain-containing protein [Methanomassiliicoccales archaeon]